MKKITCIQILCICLLFSFMSVWGQDTTKTITIIGDGHVGIGYGTEFKIGERVNKVNTKLWGIVSAIRDGFMTKACYYVEFENGDQYWVQEELLCGEKKKYLLEINKNQLDQTRKLEIHLDTLKIKNDGGCDGI